MSEVVLAEVEDLKIKAIESEKNTNCLVDLFPYLSVSFVSVISVAAPSIVYAHVQSTHDEVAEAAASALCQVFIHYIENYYDNIVPVPPVQCKLLGTNNAMLQYCALQVLCLNKYFIVGCTKIIYS